MSTPRKYDFKPGPCPEAQCTILSVRHNGKLARDVEVTIKQDCCGRVSTLVWQGMISRITRGSGLCWKCASDQAMEKTGRRVSLEPNSCDRGHPDFLEPPAWRKPKSIPGGIWRAMR